MNIFEKGASLFNHFTHRTSSILESHPRYSSLILHAKLLSGVGGKGRGYSQLKDKVFEQWEDRGDKMMQNENSEKQRIQLPRCDNESAKQDEQGTAERIRCWMGKRDETIKRNNDTQRVQKNRVYKRKREKKMTS